MKIIKITGIPSPTPLFSPSIPPHSPHPGITHLKMCLAQRPRQGQVEGCHVAQQTGRQELLVDRERGADDL